MHKSQHEIKIGNRLALNTPTNNAITALPSRLDTSACSIQSVPFYFLTNVRILKI